LKQATLESLAVLVADGIRLREVHLSDAAARTALLQRPEASGYLDPPPGTAGELGTWIVLTIRKTTGRRGRTPCLTAPFDFIYYVDQIWRSVTSNSSCYWRFCSSAVVTP
jgi:hypothetical protein